MTGCNDLRERPIGTRRSGHLFGDRRGFTNAISFLDEFLTDACGVEVLTHAQGQVAVRAFSGDGTGPVEVFTLSVALTAMAGDNTYRFRDVGLTERLRRSEGCSAPNEPPP